MTRSGGIELAGLTKSFNGPKGPVRAVRGIDVSIAVGETVALLGPNGAGKSTTIDMILGLLEPDRGAVSVFGRPPSKAVDQGAVGAMLQTGALIKDLSVRELVTMMASLYPAPLGVPEGRHQGVVAQHPLPRHAPPPSRRARFCRGVHGSPVDPQQSR